MALCLLMSQSGNLRLLGGPTSLAPCVNPLIPAHGLEAQNCTETKCVSLLKKTPGGSGSLLDSGCPRGRCGGDSGGQQHVLGVTFPDLGYSSLVAECPPKDQVVMAWCSWEGVGPLGGGA